jgi:hypothetical protein
MRLFILVLVFLLLYFCNIPSVKADCIKQITVQEVTYKSNPNTFKKVENQYVKGEKKEIWINCALFDNIKVGDELMEPGDPVDRIRLFSKDNGVLERKRYIVLKK